MKAPAGRLLVLLLLAPMLCAFDPWSKSNSEVEEGNSKLAAGKLKEALQHYQRAASELPEDPGVQYNLGIAHYRLGQLQQARQALVRAGSAADKGLRAKAFYNLGNVQMDEKHFKEAVAAYRQALQLRPGHRPTQWNLELALRRLREEQEKKKKEQEKNKNKKEQKKDPKKDQKKDQKDPKDQNKSQDPQQQQKPQPKNDKKQEPRGDRKKDQPQKAQPKKDRQPPEMNQVLEALDRNDKNLQRQRARMLMGGDLPRPAKDW